MLAQHHPDRYAPRLKVARRELERLRESIFCLGVIHGIGGFTCTLRQCHGKLGMGIVALRIFKEGRAGQGDSLLGGGRLWNRCYISVGNGLPQQTGQTQ